MKWTPGNSFFTAGSLPRVEPQLSERNVGVAKPAHLDAPDVRLEEPFVRVVPDRGDRGLVHDHLLGSPVQLDAPWLISLLPRLKQEIVDNGVGVSREVARTPGIE